MPLAGPVAPFINSQATCAPRDRPTGRGSGGEGGSVTETSRAHGQRGAPLAPAPSTADRSQQRPASGAVVTPLHGHGHGPGRDCAAPTLEQGHGHPRSLQQATERMIERRRQLVEQPVPSGVGCRPRAARTARERIELLLDPESFVELDPYARHRASGFGMEQRRPYTDGVVTGWGTVDGRRVCVFAHDNRIFGGALGEVFAAKIHKVMDLAESMGVPLIGLNDGGGARIQEGVDALAGFGGIFARNVRSSGVIPQLSVVLGPCAGGAVYSPALTDFVFVVRKEANMFITGPDVVAAVTGERVSREELGGATVHATRTGVATFLADDEASCMDDVRYLLSFLPANNQEAPPAVVPSDAVDRPGDRLMNIVPIEPHRVYDVRDVIAEVVDDGEYLELHEHWARNVVCALARLGGAVVGVVANQPLVLAGALDIDASEKAAGFVRTCDAFNIPLVTLVDVPGFLPGRDQEHSGIIRRGAKLLYAYCEASVPRVQVVLRKAYGGAYIVMDSKSIGADLAFGWPSNEVAVMGAEAAARIIFHREIAAAPDPDARRRELASEYTERLMNPYVAAERGLLDDIIDPRETRSVLIRSLELLRSKRQDLPCRKHGNIPL
jgi:acetyl-CoA carboxylase carboxyltransferase component